MADLEYPRWVHREGHPSAVVEDAAEHDALLAQWNREDARQAELRLLQSEPRNALMDVPSDEPVIPRRGGWPKGKPRHPKSATVN